MSSKSKSGSGSGSGATQSKSSSNKASVSSNKEKRNVTFLLLGEKHNSTFCDRENVNIIQEFIEDSLQESPETVLFCSEMRTFHPCYESLLESIPEDKQKMVHRLLEVDTESDTDADALEEIAFTIDELESLRPRPIYVYHFKLGEKDSPGILYNFLEKVGGVTSFETYYTKFFELDSAKQMPEYDAKLGTKLETERTNAFKELTSTIINNFAKTDVPQEIQKSFISFVQNGFTKRNIDNLTYYSTRNRDILYSKKIYNYIQANKEITKVILIIGDFHFTNLYSVFKKVSFIKMHEKSRPFSDKKLTLHKEGGKQTRKAYYRKSHKYRKYRKSFRK